MCPTKLFPWLTDDESMQGHTLKIEVTAAHRILKPGNTDEILIRENEIVVLRYVNFEYFSRQRYHQVFLEITNNLVQNASLFDVTALEKPVIIVKQAVYDNEGDDKLKKRCLFNSLKVDDKNQENSDDKLQDYANTSKESSKEEVLKEGKGQALLQRLSSARTNKDGKQFICYSIRTLFRYEIN
jgi:hypothetical protein